MTKDKLFYIIMLAVFIGVLGGMVAFNLMIYLFLVIGLVMTLGVYYLNPEPFRYMTQEFQWFPLEPFSEVALIFSYVFMFIFCCVGIGISYTYLEDKENERTL